jgi:hypothetical protein
MVGISNSEFKQLKQQVTKFQYTGLKTWFTKTELQNGKDRIDLTRLSNKQHKEIIRTIKEYYNLKLGNLDADTIHKLLQSYGIRSKSILHRELNHKFVLFLVEKLPELDKIHKHISQEKLFKEGLWPVRRFILANTDKWKDIIELERTSNSTDFITDVLHDMIKVADKNSQTWPFMASVIKALDRDNIAIYFIRYNSRLINHYAKTDKNEQGRFIYFLSELSKSGDSWQISIMFSIFLSGLSDFIIKNPQSMSEIIPIMGEVFKKDVRETHYYMNYDDTERFSKSFFQAALEGLSNCKITSIEEFERYCLIAKAYYDFLGESEYVNKLVSENLPKLAAITITYKNKKPLIKSNTIFNRLTFQKTGSKLIPLGGTLTGYLIRIVTIKAYRTWVYASEVLKEKTASGEIINHCEEIVLDKNGRPRVTFLRKGKVAVITRYAGQALRADFASRDDGVYRQHQWILNQLDAHGIVHGHAHDGNFCVRKENGKDLVTMIDFDQAVSPATIKKE